MTSAGSLASLDLLTASLFPRHGASHSFLFFNHGIDTNQEGHGLPSLQTDKRKLLFALGFPLNVSFSSEITAPELHGDDHRLFLTATRTTCLGTSIKQTWVNCTGCFIETCLHGITLRPGDFFRWNLQQSSLSL